MRFFNTSHNYRNLTENNKIKIYAYIIDVAHILTLSNKRFQATLYVIPDEWNDQKPVLVQLHHRS